MDENQFLTLGLCFAGYNFPNKYKEETNICRFQLNFGCHPTTCRKLWFDLQNTPKMEGRIDPNTKPIFLLIGLRFLWRYQTEEELGIFLAFLLKQSVNIIDRV